MSAQSVQINVEREVQQDFSVIGLKNDSKSL